MANLLTLATILGSAGQGDLQGQQTAYQRQVASNAAQAAMYNAAAQRQNDLDRANILGGYKVQAAVDPAAIRAGASMYGTDARAGTAGDLQKASITKLMGQGVITPSDGAAMISAIDAQTSQYQPGNGGNAQPGNADPSQQQPASPAPGSGASGIGGSSPMTMSQVLSPPAAPTSPVSALAAASPAAAPAPLTIAQAAGTPAANGTAGPVINTGSSRIIGGNDSHMGPLSIANMLKTGALQKQADAKTGLLGAQTTGQGYKNMSLYQQGVDQPATDAATIGMRTAIGNMDNAQARAIPQKVGIQQQQVDQTGALQRAQAAATLQNANTNASKLPILQQNANTDSGKLALDQTKFAQAGASPAANSQKSQYWNSVKDKILAGAKVPVYGSDGKVSGYKQRALLPGEQSIVDTANQQITAVTPINYNGVQITPADAQAELSRQAQQRSQTPQPQGNQ